MQKSDAKYQSRFKSDRPLWVVSERTAAQKHARNLPPVNGVDWP
jgi:hypothetical protein